MCNYTVGINCLDNFFLIKQDFAVVVVIVTLNYVLICIKSCFNTYSLNLHTEGSDSIFWCSDNCHVSSCSLQVHPGCKTIEG